jgi:conserved domain protein
MQQIITCTGYGFTGSSAATNIIEEFENVKSLDAGFECTFLHEPDGIRDLETAFKEGHRLKVDMAVKRFLRLVNILNSRVEFQKYFNGKFEKHSIDYINSICTTQWKGNWHRGSDTIKFSKQDLLYYNLAKQIFLNEYSYKNYSLYEPDTWHPTYQMRNKSFYAFFDDSFYAKTQDYIKKLFLEVAIHTDAKRVLIDQFFSAYNISAYLKYAPQTKVVIVDRDPRDLYVLNKSSWGEPYIPTDDVNTFISWYRGTRFSQKVEAENNNVLLLHFEELIFDYENSLWKLKNFLDLRDGEHIKKGLCFNPKKSAKNTYKFKNYPQWKDDILKIEKELSDYCYDFPNGLDNDSKVDESNPVEKYIQYSHEFQVKKKLPEEYKDKVYKLLFGMTSFGSVCESFNHRKTLKTKVKGFIKLLVFFPFFLLEFPYIIFSYYNLKNEIFHHHPHL